mmetsp:Transcript_12002/g.35497  ORF Transcript_12002/g.35497 Transcript_12002/m.35497 type:complete len:235 (-) Transcript_12002:473-1177(-)
MSLMRHTVLDGRVYARVEPSRAYLVDEPRARHVAVHAVAHGRKGDADAAVLKLAVQRLEHVDCGRVQRDHCGALNHHVAHARHRGCVDAAVLVGGRGGVGPIVKGEDELAQLVADEGDVCKVDGRADAHDEHAVHELADRVLLDVSPDGRPGQPPQDDHLRPHRLEDDDKEGDADAEDDRVLDAEQQRAQKGEDPKEEVGPLHPPEVARLRDVDEVGDRRDDDRREDVKRQKVE